MADIRDITGLVGILTASFPNNKVSRETIQIYQRTLSDLPLDVLEMAILQLVTTSKFFPTVSEIRDASFSIMANKSGIPSAFEAWGEAMDHCRKSNYKDYSHPLIEKTVNIIGIDYWHHMTYDDEMATRAQFFKIYEGLLRRAELEAKTLPQVKEFSENYQNQVTDGIRKLVSKMEEE